MIAKSGVLTDNCFFFEIFLLFFGLHGNKYVSLRPITKPLRTFFQVYNQAETTFLLTNHILFTLKKQCT